MSIRRKNLIRVCAVITLLVCQYLASCSPSALFGEEENHDPFKAKLISTAEPIKPKPADQTTPQPTNWQAVELAEQPGLFALPSPTPYSFSSSCAPCIPTQTAQYTFIRSWREFELLYSLGVEKYVYFPVTVLHMLNSVDFLASWGLTDQSQVIWAQIKKGGGQSTEMIQPGMRLTLYGQINTQPACTDDLNGLEECFPVIADVIMADY